MLLVECSCEEDNVTEEVDSAAGNWGIAEEETEFSLETFEMPVVPICFADSVKKYIFLVYALGPQRSQLLGGLLTFAAYIYFLLISFPFFEDVLNKIAGVNAAKPLKHNFTKELYKYFADIAPKKSNSEKVPKTRKKRYFFSLKSATVKKSNPTL